MYALQVEKKSNEKRNETKEEDTDLNGLGPIMHRTNM